MKKIFYSVQGLFYYYSSGATHRIPYFSTISASALMVYLHILQIGIFLNRFFEFKLVLFPIPDVHRGVKYLFFAAYLIPIYYILTLLFPKKKIEKYTLGDRELKMYRNVYFGYVVINIIVLILLLSDKIEFA